MGPDPDFVEFARQLLANHPELQGREIDFAYALQADADTWIDRQLERLRGAPVYKLRTPKPRASE